MGGTGRHLLIRAYGNLLKEIHHIHSIPVFRSVIHIGVYPLP